MKKYEFTGETKVEYGVILKRIRRLSNGELGGWIEKEENLSQISDSAWVSGSARVFESAQVFGSARVCESARVFGSARVSGEARVSFFDDIMSITNLIFNLTVTRKDCAIGCHVKTHAEWLAITKEEAVKMGLPEEDFFFWKDLLKLLFSRMKEKSES